MSIASRRDWLHAALSKQRLTTLMVMEALSDTDVIETLESYGFTTRTQTPWRGEEPDPWDAYPVEIGELPDFSRDDNSANDVTSNNGSQSQWGSVADQVWSQSRQGQHLPPPGTVDALAWYLPLHYYGPDWGIFIKEIEVIRIAGLIKQRLGGGRPDWIETQELCRVALSALYLHEAFHHKIESFAIRLEISRLSPVYIQYDENVFKALLGTDGVLEEAIACSEMHTRLRKEKSFHGNVRYHVKTAALRFLEEWIPTLPPGYRRGLDRRLPDELGVLMSQVAHGNPHPSQNPNDWAVASQMIRGLFNKNLVAHVVVPVGTSPVIPWLNAARYLSLSTRRVERHIIREFGYVDTGRGKGSHRHFHCQGRSPITLPANRESLSPVVQRQVAKALGYKNCRELAEHC
jgi:predicted RNA binding protein YcfA (HicA-like mRNA interferase family)